MFRSLRADSEERLLHGTSDLPRVTCVCGNFRVLDLGRGNPGSFFLPLAGKHRKQQKECQR